MLLLDLFAGAGGLSCGLRRAGFEAIYANEIDPIYASTYANNYDLAEVSVEDIRNIDPSSVRKGLSLNIGELDLLAGGPPCQGFSVNAPARSLWDERNHLFRNFLHFAKVFSPKAILIENVPGIVSLGRGEIIKELYRELEGLGYDVSHSIIFAGHYGVPQTRFRIFFIAIRKGISSIRFPSPTHNATAIANFAGAKELCQNVLPIFAQHLAPCPTVWDAISDLPAVAKGKNEVELEYATPPESAYQVALREDCNSVRNHRCAGLGAKNLERLRYIPQGGSWRDIPFDLLPNGMKRARKSDHTRRYGRLRKDGLCSTILTKCDPHWGSFFHPTQDRVISVREAARIQSFPDRHCFEGTLTQQYAQVGNAVPPLIAEALGKTLVDMIDKNGTKSKRFG